ncbi:lipoprotein [Streptomyces lincolnensis]|uniref:Lipoprotein n=1 Tax=Streptomyces lincolnensis TaxID=1915 RepID=A0A1B1MI74_STRLN|nr:class F sortase [Streptomyces lincolnensis]ANS68301.1 lipoprotein [Streptomyces lincolnensis]AXG53495.1 lipoprotein [Streptomyces lincolnensis]
MTSPSRRAAVRRPGICVVAVATAALLVSCGGSGGPTAAGGSAGTRATDERPTGTPSSADPGASVKSPQARGRSVPVGLRIPAIGVDTPVMRLGLAPDGSVRVPPITADDRAGWYEHSPTPGQTGPSVILGHVTVGKYGDGVFRHLDRLRRGERIEARLENGTTAEFAVTDVRTVAKADFPAEDVYGNVNRPELRLITCGGPLAEDGYRDNVIVFAVSTSATSSAGER